jgi:hypothetical protein
MGNCDLEGRKVDTGLPMTSVYSVEPQKQCGDGESCGKGLSTSGVMGEKQHE